LAVSLFLEETNCQFHPTAAIWLCYVVLHAQCSTVSSALAHTSITKSASLVPVHLRENTASLSLSLSLSLNLYCNHDNWITMAMSVTHITQNGEFDIQRTVHRDIFF